MGEGNPPSFCLPSDCSLTFESQDEFAFTRDAWLCPLCNGAVQCRLTDRDPEDNDTGYWDNRYRLFCCDACKWWSLRYDASYFVPPEEAYCYGYTFSVERTFDIGDKELPLAHLRTYVVSHPEVMTDIHSRKLEELIAAIFREHGFKAEMTAYSKDGGVDVIVFEHGNRPVAVQVKRYRRDRKIRVDEIHQFLGAMIVGGFVKGVFVTTSAFTRGVHHLVLNARLRDLGIELVAIDAEGLVDLFRSGSVQPSVEPWDVAWALRRCLPSVETIHGDWGPVVWPTHEVCQAHLDWWHSEFIRLMRDGIADEKAVRLPKAMSSAKLSRTISKLHRGQWIQCFRIPRGKPPHDCVQGPFWDYKDDVLWLGADFGLRMGHSVIVDGPRTRKRGTAEGVYYRGERELAELVSITSLRETGGRASHSVSGFFEWSW